MQKILTMNYPVITCYPNHANLLSIISQNNNYVPWFLSNYIQLFADKDDYKKDYLRLDFYHNDLWSHCPLIYCQRISRSIVKKAYNSVIDFFIDCVQDNSYVYLIVDKFSIAKYKDAFQKNHNIHDIFIYGFDLKKEIFYAADNFHNGSYSYEEIPFHELLDAYKNVEKLRLDDWLEGVHLIKYREATEFFGIQHKFKFDKRKIINELYDYLNLKSTPERYANPYAQWMIYGSRMGYGLEVFDIITHYLKNAKQVYDKRPLYVLWEHKRIMLMRIKYLEENSYLSENLSESYAGIVQTTEILNKLFLKYTHTDDSSILDRIINKLLIIKNEERKILENLLFQLSSNVFLH